MIVLLLSLICFTFFLGYLQKSSRVCFDRIDYMKNETKSALILCRATNTPLSRIAEKIINEEKCWGNEWV